MLVFMLSVILEEKPVEPAIGVSSVGDGQRWFEHMQKQSECPLGGSVSVRVWTNLSQWVTYDKEYHGLVRTCM